MIQHDQKLSLGVCILFFEKLGQTIECIQSFLPSKVPLYILNNGSSAGSRERLGEFCRGYPQIEIFDSQKNLGVAVGRNLLINCTKVEWLFFVDNDITIKTEDYLEKVVSHIRFHPEIQVFIPRLFNVHDDKYEERLDIVVECMNASLKKKPSGNIVNSFPGGASIVNRSVFDRYGNYDKMMFVGFEDYELSLRAILAEDPITALHVDDLELLHDHRRTKNRRDSKAASVRYRKNLHKASLQRIADKHGIYFYLNWENWLSEQREKVLNKKPLFSLQEIKVILAGIRNKFRGR